ncbi:MAG: EAL domain-containing protein [Armatimonadota bacterium]|nr:EAL domain-containing protein [Armatimonadota bacterium]
MPERTERAAEILQACLRMAEWLLASPACEEGNCEELLRLLGEAAGVSRVYVFENHVAADGTLLTSQRHEWCAPGIEPQADNPDLQDFPWEEGGFGRWVRLMREGQPVYGLVRDFPPAERAVLEAQQIRSLAAVPIFAHGRWWGFVGFDDCWEDRAWAPEEISALRLAARLLGAALDRQRAGHDLRLTAGVATRLLGCTSWQQVVDEIHATLGKQLRPDGLSLFVVEPTGTYLGLVASRGDPPAFLPGTVLPLLPQDAWCGAWAVAHGRVSWVQDLKTPDLPFRVSPVLDRAGVRSLVLVPLTSEARITGCLVMDYRSPVQLDPADLQACEATRPVIAVATERVRDHTSYQDLFARVPVGLYRSTPDGTVLQVNRFLAQLLGYPSPEALMALKAQDVYADPQDRERWRQLMDTAGRVDDFETRMRRADGQLVWVLESARTVFGPDGRPLYYDGCVVDYTTRRALQDQVSYLSRHDPLTGVANREEFLHQLSARLQARHRPAVLLVDLNDFHQVNEEFGPATGDRALQWVAQTLRAHVRSTDVVARVGGDRFAVLLPDADARVARRTAERLLQALRAPAAVAGVQVRVWPRCGAAVLGRSRSGATELFRAAESALDRAKSPPGFSIAHPSPRRRRVMWTERIREALREDRLGVFAQPILDLRTDQLDRWELLLRFRESSRWVGPDRFLHEVERSGLVVELDLWVLRRALELTGRLPGYVHVNFSGRTLSDPHALERAVGLLQSTPEGAGCLAVEITETAVLQDLQQAARFIQALRLAGACVVLDDFGVGYSSLAHLRHLQVDGFKIDGSFVRHMRSNARDRHLVRSLVEMGHALGCLVIAEWVEDPSTLQLLREFGADCAQGFYVARPAPLPSAARRSAACPAG